MTITHRFRNSFETHAATNVISNINMIIDGSAHIYDGPDVNHGNVFPGDEASTSFSYTFSEDAAGDITLNYFLSFKMMGQEYVFGARSLEFSVISVLEPFEIEPSDIEFNTSLSASPTTINSGDNVDFEVTFENTSDDTIEMFALLDAEGHVIGATETLRPGESGSMAFSMDIFETSDISYEVAAHTGDITVTKETNSVHITVRDTPEVSGGPTATSGGGSLEEAEDGIADGISAETLADGETEDGEVSDDDLAFDSADEQAVTLEAQTAGLSTLAVILIIIGGILLAALGVTTYLLISRKKKNTT